MKNDVVRSDLNMRKRLVVLKNVKLNLVVVDDGDAESIFKFEFSSLAAREGSK